MNERLIAITRVSVTTSLSFFLSWSTCYGNSDRNGAPERSNCQDYFLNSSSKVKRKIQILFPENESAIYIVNENSVPIAQIQYKYDQKERNLWINMTYIEPPFRRMGLYDLLHSKLLELFPETEYVSSALVEDNFQAYKNAMKISPNPLIAVQSTPAFKSRIKLGFSVIETVRRQNLLFASFLPSQAEIDDGAKGATLVLSKHGDH